MSTLCPLQSRSTLAIGFLCEYNDKFVKVFDVRTRKLQVIPNTYDDEELVIGSLHVFKHMKLGDMSEVKIHNRNVMVQVENGTDVFIKTVATSPRMKDLTEEVFQKYQGKVWSPYLGFLRDPKNLFQKAFVGGELGCITAKYAPDEDSVFELVFADIPVQLMDEELAKTPWFLEQWNLPLELPKLHPSKVVFKDKYRKLNDSHHTIRFAICVGVNVGNAQYNPKCHGSSERCAHFISVQLGMYRCLKSVKLGSWYQHGINDQRNKKDYRKVSRSKPMNTYGAVTVNKPFEIDAPLPTRVVKGEVEIEVEFLFDQDALEFEGELRKDAHFWNDYLGRVEVHRKTSMEIVWRVEFYRKNLPDQFKSAPITVVATVKLHERHYQNNLPYPNRGLLLMSKVIGLKDFNGNVVQN